MKISNCNYRTSKLLTFLLLFVFVIVGDLAYAKEENHVEDPGDFDFGTWSNDGNISLSQLHCVASASSNNTNGTLYDYELRVRNRFDSNNYYLYLNGDTNMTGNSRIEVIIKHEDVAASSSLVQLVPDAYDTHQHSARYKNCPLTGDNSKIEISILNTELSQAAAGDYQGFLKVEIQAGASGNKKKRKDFDMVLTKTSSLVRITSVDNFALGNYGFTGNITDTERFCVHSQTGDYSLTVSSTNQDSNGNFYLSNATSTQLPYTLMFIDSGVGQGDTNVLNLPLSGQGDSTSETCSGADNATLTLTIDEQGLQASETGSYSDTINLTIAPE
jgi:hypothetical protein